MTVTDSNSCTQIDSTIIIEPAILSSSIIGTNVSCNGGNDGTADLTTSGGTLPCSFLWSNGDTTEDVTSMFAATYNVLITDASGCSIIDSVTITEPASVSTGIVTTDVSCAGNTDGSADLTTTGGVLPYSYLWSNGATTEDISSLAAGTYYVTVTDFNSCIKTDSVVIAQPTSISTSIVGTNVTCFNGNDGAANLIVSGGTAPFGYLWSNGATTEDITSINAGTYIVTVTDFNSCIKVDSVTLTQSTPLVLNTSKTDASCGNSDGIAIVSVTGSISPYTYLWSNGQTNDTATGLAAALYQVLVTDSLGCQDSVNININDLGAPSLTIQGTNITCNGANDGIVDLTVSGGVLPYSFLWSNGDTIEDLSGLNAATYSVTVTDSSSCTAIDFQVISEPGVLATSKVVTDISCNGAGDGSINITVSGGTSPFTYAWSSGATTEDISGLAFGTYYITVTDTNLCNTTDSGTISEPTLLSASVAGTDISCNGSSDGSVDLTASGGVLPYSFLWSNGATTEDISALTAGTYYVTVTDSNSCTQIDSSTIIEPASLSSSTTGTNVTCNAGNDGAVDLTITGGLTPFTFLWSNGDTTEDLSGLVASTYTVVITDSVGCPANDSFTITEPTAILSSIAGTNASCSGSADGSANLTVSGGILPYSYLWSNGATTEDISSLNSGTYIITITDSNLCIVIDSIIITEAVSVTTSIIGTNVTCFNGSDGAANLTASGGTPPFTYLWSNGATTEDIASLTSGTYIVTVTDSNLCTKEDSITLNNPAQIISSIAATNASCFGDTNGIIDLTVSAGINPYSYSWSNGSTTEDLINLGGATYYVTITDSNLCTISDSAVIFEPSILATTIADTSISCFGSNDGSINLTSSGGTTPYSYLWSNAAITQDLSGLAPNTYYVTVTDSNLCTIVDSATIVEPAILATSIVSTSLSCYNSGDGAVNLTVTGGVTAYNYSWSNGATTQDISSLPIGSYVVTVTDLNLCTITDSAILTEPTQIITSITGTNASCMGINDGAANLSVSGGGTPYTYLWSNGATTQNISGVAMGTYYVTVTDSILCAVVDTVIIGGPAAIIPGIVGANISCNGNNDGSATLSVTGGNPPYTYLWSNGATTMNIINLIAGTYIVTITDSIGCIGIDSATIIDPGVLNSTVIGVDNICNGGNIGSIDLTVLGGTTPFTYLWSNGAITEDLTALVAGSYVVTITDSSGCIKSDSSIITEPATSITTGIVATHVSCNGGNDGAADLTVSGGMPPYTYLWSNGATTEDISGLTGSVSFTFYTVTVTDSLGCAVSKSIGILEPFAISSNIVGTNVSCNSKNDGEADLTVTNGIPAYTYLWSNGSTNEDLVGVGPGTYSVTITDQNSCTSFDLIAITQPGALTLNVSKNDVNCNGAGDGTATANPSGGIPPYTYLWDNGQTTKIATGLVPGTYVVTVNSSNARCSFDSTTIFEPSALTISMSKTDVICPGDGNGTATANVLGGTIPYTYLWSDGQTTAIATGLSGGTYTVTATDNKSCIIIDNITIIEPAPMLAITSSTPETIGLKNGTATVDSVIGGTPPYTYRWSDNQTTKTAVGLGAGMYTVQITDILLCSITDTVFVEGVSGISVDNAKFTIHLYPNPTENELFLEYRAKMAYDLDIKIYNILGEVVYRSTQFTVKKANYSIDLSQEPGGLYFVHIRVESGLIIRKIVIAK